jgi:hypothetical protein
LKSKSDLHLKKHLIVKNDDDEDDLNEIKMKNNYSKPKNESKIIYNKNNNAIVYKEKK